jgi:hypothetical protein
VTGDDHGRTVDVPTRNQGLGDRCRAIFVANLVRPGTVGRSSRSPDRSTCFALSPVSTSDWTDAGLRIDPARGLRP